MGWTLPKGTTQLTYIINYHHGQDLILSNPFIIINYNVQIYYFVFIKLFTANSKQNNQFKIQKYIHLPAIRSTARSAGSNWSMLRGLSFAQSLRLWSESKSMTVGFQTTHRPQAVTDPSTANTRYTQDGIGCSWRNRTALVAKVLKTQVDIKMKKKKLKKNFFK